MGLKKFLFPSCRGNQCGDCLPDLPTSNSLGSFKRSYSIRATLGKGSFGEVFLVQSKKEKTKSVAKVIKDASIQEQVRRGRCQTLPIEVWASIRLTGHPNTMAYVEHRRIGGRVILVTEYLRDFTDLFEVVDQYGALGDVKTRGVVRQLVGILEHCLKLGINHGDIKEENILYNRESGQIKLIDFGSATFVEGGSVDVRERRSGVYLPPETYLSNTYCPRSATVWSIGCVAFTLLSSYTPFPSVNDLTRAEPNWRLLDSCTEYCVDFVRSCLAKDPMKRMTMAMARHHIWLQSEQSLMDLCSLDFSV
eukprot:sb/3467171/